MCAVFPSLPRSVGAGYSSEGEEIGLSFFFFFFNLMVFTWYFSGV